MGDDGEPFSSNSNKPSFEQEPSEQHSIQGEKLNGGELQCEFVPQSGGDSNVSTFDLDGREGLAESGTQEAEEAVRGGVQESGGMHAADDREDKTGLDVEDGMGAGTEEGVGGGGEGTVLEAQVEVLTEKVGGENSDFRGFDETATNEEVYLEVLAEQACEAVAAEEVKAVVDTLDSKEDAITGDTEQNDSDVGIIAGGRDGTVVDVAVAMVEEENPIAEPDHLQSIAGGSITVEGEAKLMVTPVESSRVMTGAEVEETNEEGVLTAQVKRDAFIEVTEESNAENATGLQGLQFAGYESPDLAKEEVNQMGGINDKVCLVADTEMDDLKGTEELEISMPNDLQSVIVANDEGIKERLPGEIPISDTVLEVGKEAETGAINAGDVESICKPDDLDFIHQDDEDEEMVAEEESPMADTGMETEAGVGEEQIGKEDQIETVEAGNARSIPNIDDVPRDEEDEEIVAKEEPALVVLEMETNTGAVEEPRVLGLEQGKGVESNTVHVGDVESILKIDDAKLVTLDNEEDGETVAEEESSMVGMEMETQTDVGDERRLLGLEKGKAAETETAEVDNVENFPKIDDAKHVTQDEGGDEEVVAEEESALADTEVETETDVGESSRIVGVKQKRGRNSKILTNSKTLSKAQKIMEEDVCFICFDGGDLVLCDRR